MLSTLSVFLSSSISYLSIYDILILFLFLISIVLTIVFSIIVVAAKVKQLDNDVAEIIDDNLELDKTIVNYLDNISKNLSIKPEESKLTTSESSAINQTVNPDVATYPITEKQQYLENQISSVHDMANNTLAKTDNQPIHNLASTINQSSVPIPVTQQDIASLNPAKTLATMNTIPHVTENTANSTLLNNNLALANEPIFSNKQLFEKLAQLEQTLLKQQTETRDLQISNRENLLKQEYLDNNNNLPLTSQTQASNPQTLSELTLNLVEQNKKKNDIIANSPVLQNQTIPDEDDYPKGLLENNATHQRSTPRRETYTDGIEPSTKNRSARQPSPRTSAREDTDTLSTRGSGRQRTNSPRTSDREDTREDIDTLSTRGSGRQRTNSPRTSDREDTREDIDTLSTRSSGRQRTSSPRSQRHVANVAEREENRTPHTNTSLRSQHSISRASRNNNTAKMKAPMAIRSPYLAKSSLRSNLHSTPSSKFQSFTAKLTPTYNKGSEFQANLTKAHRPALKFSQSPFKQQPTFKQNMPIKLNSNQSNLFGKQSSLSNKFGTRASSISSSNTSKFNPKPMKNLGNVAKTSFNNHALNSSFNHRNPVSRFSR